MFYSTQILCNKKGLGLVWIAAHMEKTLKKHQVLEANLETSVDSLQGSGPPMALRLSSHLMLGIVRIYGHKARYLQVDAEYALSHFMTGLELGETAGAAIEAAAGGRAVDRALTHHARGALEGASRQLRELRGGAAAEGLGGELIGGLWTEEEAALLAQDAAAEAAADLGGGFTPTSSSASASVASASVISGDGDGASSMFAVSERETPGLHAVGEVSSRRLEPWSPESAEQLRRQASVARSVGSGLSTPASGAFKFGAGVGLGPTPGSLPPLLPGSAGAPPSSLGSLGSQGRESFGAGGPGAFSGLPGIGESPGIVLGAGEPETRDFFGGEAEGLPGGGGFGDDLFDMPIAAVDVEGHRALSEDRERGTPEAPPPSRSARRTGARSRRPHQKPTLDEGTRESGEGAPVLVSELAARPVSVAGMLDLSRERWLAPPLAGLLSSSLDVGKRTAVAKREAARTAALVGAPGTGSIGPTPERLRREAESARRATPGSASTPSAAGGVGTPGFPGSLPYIPEGAAPTPGSGGSYGGGALSQGGYGLEFAEGELGSGGISAAMIESLTPGDFSARVSSIGAELSPPVELPSSGASAAGSGDSGSAHGGSARADALLALIRASRSKRQRGSHKGAVDFANVVPQPKGRLEASRAFFDALVLRSRGQILMQQASPFERILVTATTASAAHSAATPSRA